LFVSMVIHEASHGIQMLREKLRLESAGLILVGLLPLGAFVEPNEREMKKAEELRQLRVYSAGPSSNFLSLIPFWLVFLLFSSMAFVPAKDAFESAYIGLVDHVEVGEVRERLGYCGNPVAPAFGKLEEGMTILEINSVKITSSPDVLEALSTDRFKPASFLVEKGGVRETIVLVPHDVTGSFGFGVTDIQKPGAEFPAREFEAYSTTGIISSFLLFMFLIAFLLGVANFLPLVPFDGGKIAMILYAPLLKPLVKSGKKREKLVRDFFLVVMLIIIAINALPLFQ